MSDLRDQLIAGIRANREKFESAGDRAEELRTLPHDAVAILRSLGLFWLKTPAGLGGTPPPPGAGCNGLVGGWLPDEGAHQVFGAASNGVRPVVAGQLAPRGTGHAVRGGY